MYEPYKVDIRWFKMLADFHDRKCPCWKEEYTCLCPPFAETADCRCEAVLPIAIEPKMGKTGDFELYYIDFKRVTGIIENGHKCVGDDGVTCLCDEFMVEGTCRYGVFARA